MIDHSLGHSDFIGQISRTPRLPLFNQLDQELRALVVLYFCHGFRVVGCTYSRMKGLKLQNPKKLKAWMRSRLLGRTQEK